ncbi:MAG: hypothetical protein KAU50_12600, partial [Candidatus Marinimicrobia bacterium]|nr:hypothetical protein [Candidatus Neomarinimicrobiota bacterium]
MTPMAITRLLARHALPLLGVLLVGFLLYRTSIFNPELPESRLITLGITGAVLLALGANIKRWNFLIAVPLLLAADVLLMGPGGIAMLGTRWL